MRILIVSGEYPPMKGGVGRYTYHLVRALGNKSNIDIHVAINGCQDKSRATSTLYPLIINDTNSSNVTDGKYVVYNNIIKRGDQKNSHRILNLVDSLKPEIVNIQYERGLYEDDSSVSQIVRRIIYGSTLDKFYKKCPVPTVSTLHTIIPYNEYKEYIKERALRKEGRFSSLPLPIRATIRRWVMKRRYDLLLEVVRLSSEVISLARITHEIVKHGIMIYHGAEPAIPLLSPADKYKFREELGLPNDKRLLLAFGYVGSYKGFDLLNSITLPDEWSLVVKQNKHERGIERPTRIKNAISLHPGYLDEIALSKLFFACDAMIFPYKVASISGVLFDAIAHGLPFIASDLKFFREFADMNLGKTCNRDPASFSQSIAYLSANYEKYRKNVHQFSSKLRWENVANSHIAFYSKLLRLS